MDSLALLEIIAQRFIKELFYDSDTLNLPKDLTANKGSKLLKSYVLT